METILDNVQDMNKLEVSLDFVKDVITKDYLFELSKFEVTEMSKELQELDIAKYTRIYKFKKMVSDKNESVIDKFITVLNAAYSSNATVIAFISGHKSETEYFLGVVSKDIEQKDTNIETQGEILKSVLTGNFPGLEIEAVKGDAKKNLINNAFSYDYVTAISGIASVRNEKDNSYDKFVQGIEHLVDSLQDREYSVVVIADPITSNELADAKLGYETLYTQLSPFLKKSISFNESETITSTRSHTHGVTESIGESISLTQNYSKMSGWSESSSKGRNSGLLIVPSGENINETTSENGSVTESSGNSTSKNESVATQNSDTDSESEGETHGKTMQFSNENKTVKNMLEKIDRHIERLQKCEAYGAFNCATYVISSDPETTAIVSNGYNALMRGDSSSLQTSHINNWCVDNNRGIGVKQYLSKLSHPLFKNPASSDILLSPAAIANSYELAVNIGLPKKSINGLPVFSMASFGRNVFETNGCNISHANIELGEVYHMGKNQAIPVELNIKSLAMHTFVTGSTGSGKSNTVHQMLRELNRQKIKFLVIEPAKGEYKYVFSDSAAKVYGTNPYFTPLLKINPFSFPKGIHVLEHIDRIIEIFNVCWPMYAAMPAILKDSVERAYINAGWDLVTSRNKYSDYLYPTFVDILNELNYVVTESAFSQEVKDNYIGSLATRVKSLTNGIYGHIFDNDELGDGRLFDENVIVDLSRVGSVETKSMIMGILVMRLQEYRMVSGDMNADLKHVTVLEEAHNLLKRTSTDQSNESSNLLGKSVEMLSNAIAEVRTYGEGFIIADQSPGLLDMSVIRNTNTKIIMRLPDFEDRNLVGKSANLSEEQIKELAKIPTGVAAVYQNNWLEPVLCKVHYEKTCTEYNNKEILHSKKDLLKQKLVERLLNKAAGERMDLNMDQLIDEIIKSPLETKIKIKSIELLRRNGNVSLKDISPVVYDIVSSREIEKEAEDTESLEEWKNVYLYSDNSVVSEFPGEKQNEIMECILVEQIDRYGKPDEYLDTWHKFVRGEVF